MKRVIEKGSLAFNHRVQICDLCKRWNGDFTEDDERVCEYNENGKGLKNGLVENYMENYKCKYYKRNPKYDTCKLQSKSYTVTQNGISEKVKYKHGKFKRVTIKKLK